MSKMNVSKLSNNELELLKKQIMDEENVRKEKEKELQIDNVVSKLKKLSLNEEILSLIPHDRTSCSDDNPCNTSYDGIIYCRKCTLMDMIEDYKRGIRPKFDFDLSIELEEIK